MATKKTTDKSKTTEYKVISKASLDNFQRDVNAAIADGWNVLGGVSTTVDSNPFKTTYVYTQALIK